MNYKKYSRKKQAFSPKHIRWNKTHIDREMLERFQPYDSYPFQRHKTTGPLFIGKLWVSVKGNYMLLPVWSVYRGKYEAKLSVELIPLINIMAFIGFVVWYVILYNTTPEQWLVKYTFRLQGKTYVGRAVLAIINFLNIKV